MVTHRLCIEMDLLDDAMMSLERIHRNLEGRSGRKATSLELRLERAIDQPVGDLEFVRLDNSRSVAIPPKIWRDLIDEARKMGVV